MDGRGCHGAAPAFQSSLRDFFTLTPSLPSRVQLAALGETAAAYPWTPRRKANRTAAPGRLAADHKPVDCLPQISLADEPVSRARSTPVLGWESARQSAAAADIAAFATAEKCVVVCERNFIRENGLRFSRWGVSAVPNRCRPPASEIDNRLRQSTGDW